uniref:Ig-like domain-containing protein n=1 Tax=Callorhinchus milii TaxID=7868 RepID=A0A4W3HQZ2_CALMI
TQWPGTVTAREGETESLHCYQNDTDYQVMLWYLQPHQGGLTLIGYAMVSSPNYEAGMEAHYTITQTRNKESSLKISNMIAAREGVYYCAARDGHSVRERQISHT